ncbi:transmembrane protease serine 9-like [Dreissena polymorpha]|uniref:Peptidase S1 domain-containing protein n=1 Tax=Dreissena polymorpha TaxID=45954 RepID=A0A9D4M503_DREPO|nr:transmembrane protease serine 9-like [Dreissena polymorpha]KAH3869718.1 hypothetical protein DPMN_032888 [Dreissena polymorpha]
MERCMGHKVSVYIAALIIRASGFILNPDDPQQCGLPEVSHVGTRIIGGQEARPGSWPWMALLARHGQPVCGGSIITTRLILTAAHCFAKDVQEGNSLRDWRVYVGKHHVATKDSTEQSSNIRRLVLHPGFDNVTLLGDIAILELEDPVNFTSYVSPVCLPRGTGQVVPLGTYCYISGWGETQGSSNANVLNQATVPILHDYWCARADWYGAKFLYQATFCAGFKSGARDSCSGDSGGPLVCKADGRWYVQGVTSWGYGCAQPMFPGIYTDVSVYGDWIRAAAANLSATIRD